jgi:hypothetical protein
VLLRFLLNCGVLVRDVVDSRAYLNGGRLAVLVVALAALAGPARPAARAILGLAGLTVVQMLLVVATH